jgi:hypothetical protein
MLWRCMGGFSEMRWLRRAKMLVKTEDLKGVELV